MEHTNVRIINNFFEAYSRHDLNDIKKVLSNDVKWVFPGQNALSGTKVGIEEVIYFFDKMGSIMGKANVEVEKLIMGATDDYVLECQHIWTSREDGINFDQDMCILWKFKDGKIIEGKHFISEQLEVDTFFNKVF
jgi:uncharacterized protein